MSNTIQLNVSSVQELLGGGAFLFPCLDVFRNVSRKQVGQYRIIDIFSPNQLNLQMT